MAFLGGLLSRIGRGITGGIDDLAYNTAGGPLLSSILGTQAPPPQVPQAGGLLSTMKPAASAAQAMSGTPDQWSDPGTDPGGSLLAPDAPAPVPVTGATSAIQSWADAQRMPAYRQAQPAAQDPMQDPATKKMMRGMFLGALSNAISQRGNAIRGISTGGGDPMDDYRKNIMSLLLTQRAAQQAGVQQAAQRQAQAGLSQDMQAAGSDENMQRQALNKWGPYVAPELLKSYGDIAKDYRPKEDELFQIVTTTDPTDPTRQILTPYFKSGKPGTPIVSQVPEKFQSLEGDRDVVTPDGLGQPKKYIRPDGSSFTGILDHKNHQVLYADTRKPVTGTYTLAPEEKAAGDLSANDYAAISMGIDPRTGKPYVTPPGGLTPEVAGQIYEKIKPPKPVTNLNVGQQRLADKQLTQYIKYYEPASDAAVTFNTMAKNWNDAFGDPKHLNQQAMVSLLAQHIGMTTGKGGAGMRPTQAMFREAQASVPMLQGLQARFGPDGLMNGVTLTPDQGMQMVQLGHDRYVQKLQESRANARMYDRGGVIDPTGRGPLRTPDDATMAYYHNMAYRDPRVATERDPNKKNALSLGVMKQLMDQDGWSTE